MPASAFDGVGPCATAASVSEDVGAGAATSSADASSHSVGRVGADAVVQAQSAGIAVGVGDDGDSGRMLAWAALDFEGGRQVGTSQAGRQAGVRVRRQVCGWIGNREGAGRPSA